MIGVQQLLDSTTTIYRPADGSQGIWIDTPDDTQIPTDGSVEVIDMHFFKVAVNKETGYRP